MTPSTMIDTRTDEHIQRDVFAELKWDARVLPNEIGVAVKNGIVNGNDVFFDGSQEIRYVGAATLTSDDGDSFVAVGASIGRGRFNPGRPNGPVQGITTIGLAYEPAGRNNINVFDVVYSTKLDKETTYAVEGIFGYQWNVPAAATGSGVAVTPSASSLRLESMTNGSVNW